jgi:hypothetical protein
LSSKISHRYLRGKNYEKKINRIPHVVIHKKIDKLREYEKVLLTATTRRRQSKFGATNQNMPFENARARAIRKAREAKANKRKQATADAMEQSGSDSDEATSQRSLDDAPPIRLKAPRLGGTAPEDTIDVSVVVAPSIDVADTVPLSVNDNFFCLLCLAIVQQEI